MRSSSERKTSPSSSVTTRRRSNTANAVDRWAGTRWGGQGTALAAILAGAATIRLVGIQYGLPFGNLLKPDEQSIVPRAWKLVHGGGGDPHWFDYPTLLMYVNAPFQAWQSEPSFLTARIVGVVLSLGAIAAAWWLGRRAYGTGVVAAAAVAVCTIEVAYSRAAVTDVPLTLGVGAALALMVSGRIELAGMARGAARAGARTRRLAWLRARPHCSRRVLDRPLGRPRARADHLSARARRCVCPAHPRRPAARPVRRRLIPRSADAARALRPVRPADRAAPRRARRTISCTHAGDAAAPRRAADLVDPGREAVDADRHAHRRAPVGRRSHPAAHARRCGSVDAALPDARCPAPSAAGPEAAVRPEPQPRATSPGRDPLRDRHGLGHRPRARGALELSARVDLLRRSARADAACLPRRGGRRPGR